MCVHTCLCVRARTAYAFRVLVSSMWCVAFLQVVERVGAGYLMEHTAHLHRDNMGLTRAEAQAQYIREASQQEAPHNLHLYRLRYKKQDPTPTVVTAICARGLDIYEVRVPSACVRVCVCVCVCVCV